MTGRAAGGDNDADGPRKHPLQRFQSPSRGLSGLIHVLGLASFALSFKYLIDHPNVINDSYGWHLQYLTIIGLSLASLTFAVGALADLTLSPTLFEVKNVLSMTSAPMEVLISVLYWGIRAIDPSLVLPDWLEPLPMAQDLGFHAAPSIFLVVDLLFLSPPWTITALPAIAVSGAIATAYWFWVEACYAKNGFYPYPIFHVPVSQRLVLFAASAVVMTGSTFCLKRLYALVNGATDLRQTYELRSRNVKRK